MKLKKIRIVIQPIKDVKSEWSHALKGEIRSVQSRGTIIFTSLTAVAKVLSPVRLDLLSAILKHKPGSIDALANIVDRDFKNVYSDVKILTEIGLIKLKSTAMSNTVRPIAKYNGFEIHFGQDQNR